jgi:hypothetical protein
MHEADAANKAYEASRQLFNICLAIGWSLTLIGFVSWYFKIQRLEDELIRLRVINATCETRNTASRLLEDDTKQDENAEDEGS